MLDIFSGAVLPVFIMAGVGFILGRYTLAADPRKIEERFGVSLSELAYASRYNIAPNQEALTVTEEGGRRAGLMRWGLIPFWAKDPSIGQRMINARAETLMERPAFRTALLKQRCLVVADGFYEWATLAGRKVPMRIVLKSGEPFAFAGLWERWKAPSGEVVRSCTIITTTPNAVMERIHNRMPVMLPSEAEPLWLDQGVQDPEMLMKVLAPFSASKMEAYQVSTLVNSPKNDVPECIARLA